MAYLFERVGVWAVLALVTAVVLAYSLWGAAVLKAQHHGGSLSNTQGVGFDTRLI